MGNVHYADNGWQPESSGSTILSGPVLEAPFCVLRSRIAGLGRKPAVLKSSFCGNDNPK